jgi:hypothetical protein
MRGMHYNNINSQMYDTYRNLNKELYQIPKVQAWIDAKALTDNDYDILKKSWAAPVVKSDRDVDYTKTRVFVENAGVDDVNGTYVFKMKTRYAPCFTKTGPYNNKIIEYSMYKCKMSGGSMMWFISIAPGSKEPGTLPV